jgi:predicted transport protein
MQRAHTEILDPRGLCRDVSGMSTWGNGDVEVKLYELSALPYVLGLVRQALEYQLGGEGN